MSNSEQMHYVGYCRSCGTGPLGLRECGGCGEIVVMCDECDAVWTDADFSAKPTLANETGSPCPYCETSLLEKPSVWASKAAIDKLAWLQTAVDSGEMAVKRGAALSSDGPISQQIPND